MQQMQAQLPLWHCNTLSKCIQVDCNLKTNPPAATGNVVCLAIEVTMDAGDDTLWRYSKAGGGVAALA